MKFLTHKINVSKFLRDWIKQILHDYIIYLLIGFTADVNTIYTKKGAFHRNKEFINLLK